MLVMHGETWPLRCLFVRRFCDMHASSLVVNRVIPSTLTQQQRQYTAQALKGSQARYICARTSQSEAVDIALKFCSYREDAPKYALSFAVIAYQTHTKSSDAELRYSGAM